MDDAPTCPACGERLSTMVGRLEGGVTRPESDAILSCRDCGARWEPDADGMLRAYAWVA